MLSSQLVPQRSCAHFGGSFKHLFNTYLLSPSLNQTADTAVMKKEEILPSRNLQSHYTKNDTINDSVSAIT